MDMAKLMSHNVFHNLIIMSYYLAFRYLKLFNLDYPALLYLSPNFAEMLSFASWEFSKQSNVIIQIIPQSVWRNLTSAHLGVFRKIHPRFQQIAFRKLVRFQIFMKLDGRAQFFININVLFLGLQGLEMAH